MSTFKTLWKRLYVKGKTVLPGLLLTCVATYYMKMRSIIQTTLECLLRLPGKNISLHATLAFFWFRPAHLFELGCMNHHIQNVSLICIFKHFFPSEWNYKSYYTQSILKKIKTVILQSFVPPKNLGGNFKNFKSWNLDVEEIRDF